VAVGEGEGDGEVVVSRLAVIAVVWTWACGRDYRLSLQRRRGAAHRALEGLREKSVSVRLTARTMSSEVYQCQVNRLATEILSS
jgi:hypothetical protein